ncbi:MAG: hypothetical protein NTZ02_04745 [Candidatus Woesearchaeota archaeon]|nr:hypothetical protein [Candidatus Woesearchaeota archaeon]
MFETFSTQQIISILKPLLVFVGGITLYSIFIFNFYRFLARKDIFELDLEQYNTSRFPAVRKMFSVIAYMLKYMLFFPLFTFFWFGVLAMILILLSRIPNVNNVLLISIAIVSAVRITAYYNEDLSRDLAKMLPFALLGVFLIDISAFSPSASYQVFLQIPSKLELLLYYLMFAVILEFVLRMGYLLTSPFRKEENEEES